MSVALSRMHRNHKKAPVKYISKLEKAGVTIKKAKPTKAVERLRIVNYYFSICVFVISICDSIILMPSMIS